MKQNMANSQLRCGDWLWKFGTLIVLTGVVWLTSSAWHPEETLAQGSTFVPTDRGGSSVPGTAGGLGPEQIVCPPAEGIKAEKKVERSTTEAVKVTFRVPDSASNCWCWQNSTGSTSKLIAFNQSLKDKWNANIDSEGFFLDDRETLELWKFHAKKPDGYAFFKDKFGFNDQEFFVIELPAGQPSETGPKEGEEITCVSKEVFKEYVGGLAPVLEWLLTSDRLP